MNFATPDTRKGGETRDAADPDRLWERNLNSRYLVAIWQQRVPRFRFRLFATTPEHPADSNAHAGFREAYSSPIVSCIAIFILNGSSVDKIVPGTVERTASSCGI